MEYEFILTIVKSLTFSEWLTRGIDIIKKNSIYLPKQNACEVSGFFGRVRLAPPSAKVSVKSDKVSKSLIVESD